MTGFDSKRKMALAKLPDDDDTQVYADTLTVVYQRGFADGKAAANAMHDLARLGQEIEQEQAEPCIGKDPRCPCQDGDACHYKDCGDTKARPVAQPEQEPVLIAAADWAIGYVDGLKAAAQPEPPPEWEAINNIIAEYGLQAISFVAEWKAAQRPWVGLTDKEITEIYEMGLGVRASIETALDKIEERNT